MDIGVLRPTSGRVPGIKVEITAPVNPEAEPWIKRYLVVCGGRIREDIVNEGVGGVHWRVR
jgi:hypothetical protein